MNDVVTFVDSGGVKLAVEVQGEGEPVTVLAHGLSGSRADVALFAPFLPGTKVMFDFRGHGDSDRPGDGAYALDLFAQDVDAVATTFGATAFAGISLGTAAALRLLARRPDRFARLVFLLPARLDRSMSAHAQLMSLADLLERQGVETVAERVLEEEDRAGRFTDFPAGRDFRRGVVLRMNREGVPRAIREVLAEGPLQDEGDLLARIEAPALVIGQRGDPIHAAAVAEDLAETLPNAELLLFDDQHALMRRIPEVVGRVARFLAGT